MASLNAQSVFVLIVTHSFVALEWQSSGGHTQDLQVLLTLNHVPAPVFTSTSHTVAFFLIQLLFLAQLAKLEKKSTINRLPVSPSSLLWMVSAPAGPSLTPELAFGLI